MYDLIETLKKNERAWKFLSKEEQECLIGANSKAGVDNLNFAGKWENPGKPWVDMGGGENIIWRIKPDYQPKPEFVDLEIIEHGGWLMVERDNDSRFLPFEFTHIYQLSGQPYFDDFWYQDSPGCTVSGLKGTIIAKYISEGKKVFARFRR